MAGWLEIADRIEALEGLALHPELVSVCEARASPRPRPIRFYAPTFKQFSSGEMECNGAGTWPAVSVTGADCALQCDHCKARILEPMIPARTPEILWRTVQNLVAAGARGLLLTGGSNRRNEVDYDVFGAVIRRIKDTWPQFKVTVHTGLVDAAAARRLEAAGVDVAMLDVIGAQETVTQVYHLKRPVADFERALEALLATRMTVVPHIVLGLHYGHFLGERAALDMVVRHRPHALVLVVVMPQYASSQRPFTATDTHDVGRFFMDARASLPTVPLLLGCARPPGWARATIDSYAVLAGLDGIAHPADGVIELAARLGREVSATAACCAMAAGNEVLLDAAAPRITLSLDEILRAAGPGRLGGIPVVERGSAA
jgi:lipoyl synthase